MEWNEAAKIRPDKEMEVLVTNVNGWMHLERAIYYKNYDIFVLYNPRSSEKYTLDVTHWLEIPPPPKTKPNKFI